VLHLADVTSVLAWQTKSGMSCPRSWSTSQAGLATSGDSGLSSGRGSVPESALVLRESAAGSTSFRGVVSQRSKGWVAGLATILNSELGDREAIFATQEAGLDEAIKKTRAQLDRLLDPLERGADSSTAIRGRIEERERELEHLKAKRLTLRLEEAGEYPRRIEIARVNSLRRESEGNTGDSADANAEVHPEVVRQDDHGA
jgi:hypothetical protein